MDDKTIDRIFAGNFEGLPELCNTVVKIYICSTYTDMTLEKNTLQSEVYPKLREYCRERHGLEFQIVDMRWGIRDDATDDHMTTHICLEEIRNCQKTSLGPNFIFLGGQKYGYRPVPTFIPHDEFNLILNMLKEFEKNTEILTDWYEKDTNSIPVMMILQPISSHYPNFLNSQVPKLQSEDQEKWWRTLCKLQETLREAAYNLFKSGRLDEETYYRYQFSVIEREVNLGILKVEDTKAHCLAFFRTIMNINTSDKTITGKPAHYLDMENRQINKAASLLLTSLKDDKLVKKLEKGNSFRYEVEWVGVTEINVELRDEYLYKFVVDFYKSVIRLIDKAMKKVDNSTRGVLAHEIGKHMNLCVDGSPFFYGQEDNLEKVKDYVKGESRGCLLVYGRSGTGKSFLMGKIAMSVHLWLAPLIPMMVIRFIGSTSASSSIELVLFSICKQICYNLEISLEEVPEEFVPLKNFFKSLLEKASETNFVVIIMDSVEKFFVNIHENGITSWLPQNLPQNVKIVLSFKIDSKMSLEDINSVVKGICEEESNHLLLGELGYDLAISILKKWMCTMSNRRLTHFQWRTAMNAVAVCSTPLFLRLCYSQMKSWRSYTIPEETKLPFSVDAFVTLLFDQIEFKCGKQLVSRTVSYITASRHGLTESEIVDILSLDDIVLHEIFTYTKPQVRRLPPILWTKIKRELEGYITEIETDGTKVIVWAHSQFKDVCSKRYLRHDDNFSCSLYSNMSEFFLGQWSNGVEKSFKYSQVQAQRMGLSDREDKADRKVPSQPNVFISPNGKVSRYNFRKFSELPYHLVKSNRFSDLAEHALFNYDWLHSKISGSLMKHVLDDFIHALSAISDKKLYRQIFLVSGVLRLSRGVLDKFPDMIGPHLVARLLPEIRNHHYIKNLVYQCDSESSKHNSLIPVNHCLPSPGGPLKYLLEGHSFAVFGSSLTSDKRYIISVSNKFISWDIESSEVCRHVDPKTEGIMMELTITDDNRYAATYNSSNNMIIIDIMHGDFLVIPRPLEQILGISTTNDYIIIYNNFKYRIFDFEGTHLKEFIFPLQDYDILKLHYCTDDLQVTLHWHSEAEMEDSRIYIRVWSNGKPSEFVQVFNCVFFLDMGKFISYFSCYFSKPGDLYKGVSQNHNFQIIKTFQSVPDCIITKEEPIYSGNHDVFSLSTHDNYLIATTPNSFLLISLNKESLKMKDVKRLKLPSDLQNVRKKLNESNHCILASNEFNSHLAIAAVRKDIFVWDYQKEQLLRSFNGHSRRITKMHSLCENTYNIFITSSMDRTVKIWDINTVLEAVHTLDVMELSIDDIIIFESSNLIISLTRNRIAQWNLRTGELTGVFENPGGAAFDKMELSPDGKYLATSDCSSLLIWNLKARVVLFRENIENIRQLVNLSSYGLLSVSLNVYIDKEEGSKEAVVKKSFNLFSRNLVNGRKMFSLDVPVRFVLDIVITRDQNFIITMGIDKLKGTDAVYVHHTKKGSLAHKITLKYPSFKRPSAIVPYESSYIVIVDSEKGNVLDVRHRKFLKSIYKWTGQTSENGKFGLSSPTSGGLSILDLKTGLIHRNLINKSIEGVFTVKCEFTKCEKYIYYYHSKRRTIRLFRRSDGKLISNYWLHSDASVITSSISPLRIVIGGIDGSVTVLLIADIESKKYLEEIRSLPSRMVKCIDENGEDSYISQNIPREINRKDPLLRFRAIARVALFMDRVLKKNHIKTTESMVKVPNCTIC